MIILADTDVVHKLACCEFLLDFLQYLRCPPNEVWVLPALPHMLRRKLATAPGALRNFEQFMAKVRKVPSAKMETLDRMSTLDVGEQLLLAVLCEQQRVELLVTGDKRAMDRIAALSFGDAQLNERLQETSVLCLEAAMLALLKTRGFSVVQARVLKKWACMPEQTVDGLIRKAFPVDGTAAWAQETLIAGVDELKVSLPPLQFAQI